MRLRPQQDTARRGNRALPGFTLTEGIKNVELMFGSAAFRLIRTGKMADDIHRLAYIFTVRQTLVERFRLFGTHAETMHTGIQFHPDRYRLRQLHRLQGGKLLLIMYGGMQTLRGNGRQIGGVEKTLQQQDRLRDPARSQT